ncbi:cyclase family protein [Croceibacter atlanticus]|uniref:cyclase family protein n=1 Tax=Croceibacter atlanticus TaxID=313588 RepID=UPI0024B9DB55|nr:cyclase family protein [Croceibacter atlanticus]
MRATIKHKESLYTVDFNAPIDISLPLKDGNNNPEAWYLKAPKIEPVSDKKWVGKVSEGADVNFNNIWFNPHAHGTHTECVGHITEQFHSINNSLKTYMFKAKVISIVPEQRNEDFVLSKKQIKTFFKPHQAEALIIRTLPNTSKKKTRQYSNTNWPYLTEKAAAYIRRCGIQHLLIDLPSVDKEKDGGELLAHHAFWNYPNDTRFNATITELIYVPNAVKDGDYILNLQIASFENDASPSKPVLYRIL